MEDFGNRLIAFFAENFPSARALLLGGPPALAWAYLALALAGYLKQCRGLKTGYTRKIFHFLIFGTVAAAHAVWGSRGVCLFGAMTTLVVFYAVLRGPGHPMYEAMAREKDAPHRTYYIVTPYFATLIGGVLSNVLFGRYALIGYLVGGLGDAIGEPAGTRFGRHPYRVPSAWGVSSTRTLEGSLGVLLACLAAVALGQLVLGGSEPSPRLAVLLLTVAVASTLLEAVSPHGWDNAFMQVVPTFLASLWL